MLEVAGSNPGPPLSGPKSESFQRAARRLKNAFLKPKSKKDFPLKEENVINAEVVESNFKIANEPADEGYASDLQVTYYTLFFYFFPYVIIPELQYTLIQVLSDTFI